MANQQGGGRDQGQGQGNWVPWNPSGHQREEDQAHQEPGQGQGYQGQWGADYQGQDDQVPWVPDHQGQDPQGQDHYGQGQGGQQGRHPEVTRLLAERAPFEALHLLEVMAFLPGPRRKFPAKVHLTANELCIEFDRKGFPPAMARCLWQQPMGAHDQPVRLRLRQGHISVIAIATNSITLLFTVRDTDGYCSTVVLCHYANPYPKLVAFGRALALWCFPPDNLVYLNPKEFLPAYKWLMEKASDRAYDQRPEEWDNMKITYDTGLYYLHNALITDTVEQAFGKHVKYEFKKALAIVAHRLLTRLRPLHDRLVQQQLNASLDTGLFPVGHFEQPVAMADIQALQEDFVTFCHHSYSYDTFLPAANANWDDPAVDNAQSLPQPETSVFLWVDRNDEHHLRLPEGQTRVKLSRYQEQTLAQLDYTEPRQPMRLYRPDLDRWSVVERIAFELHEVTITHRDEWTQDGRPLVQNVAYEDIGYFRYSVVGQSVSCLSIHLLYRWGYTHLESQDADEIVLLQSLLRLRLKQTSLSPQLLQFGLDQDTGESNTRPAIARLFPADPLRWHSPQYGLIEADTRRQELVRSSGHTTGLDRTMMAIDDNYRAFTCRLMSKLAIKLVRSMFDQWGRMIMNEQTWNLWTTYWHYRDEQKLPGSSQCTVPHLVLSKQFFYYVPLEWLYALFDAPNEY